MSLDLDKRQRAMLREMGVQVWLPEVPVAHVQTAVKALAAVIESQPASKALPPAAPVAKVLPVAAEVRTPSPAAPVRSGGEAPSWSLGDMLRAARLPMAGAVLLAPVVRHAAAPPGEAFSAALAALIDQARPDIVLVMGRMASQALLGSTEPLGRLRGQVQPLHGARAVVTYDATYLLRAPADKAKAWDDLRLAMRLASVL